MSHCLSYSHLCCGGPVAIRVDQRRNPHDHKGNAVADQVEQRPGEAVSLDDLHLGEPSDQQVELQRLQQHPHETCDDQEVEKACHDGAGQLWKHRQQ